MKTRLELETEAKKASDNHFSNGRDAYESMADELISEIKRNIHSKYGPDGNKKMIGAFLLGIAKSNFIYGHMYSHGFDLDNLD